MDYLDTVQDFIESSRRETEAHELAALFQSTVRDLGCEYFSCVSSVNPFAPPKGAVVLSDYPLEWALRIFEKKHYLIDPVLRTVERRQTPFDWSDASWRATLTLEQLKILAEAAGMGLGNGFSVPIHSPEGYPAACSLSFGRNELDPKAKSAIHMMSIYLHEAAVRIQGKAFQPRIKPLSCRQRECLELAAQGKSDWVISQLLNISEHTAHIHIRLAIEKMNAATRTQAIVRALFRGEIKFADLSVEERDPTVRVRLPKDDPFINQRNP